jgi:hypothetical protein
MKTKLVTGTLLCLGAFGLFAQPLAGPPETNLNCYPVMEGGRIVRCQDENGCVNPNFPLRNCYIQDECRCTQ